MAKYKLRNALELAGTKTELQWPIKTPTGTVPTKPIRISGGKGYGTGPEYRSPYRGYGGQANAMIPNKSAAVEGVRIGGMLGAGMRPSEVLSAYKKKLKK